MTIKHRELADVDLNLLVALDALLTQRSVTQAANDVGVGQSAMSSALGRLRKLLGDELLTRSSEGMRLTPKAISLIEPVRSSLRQFQGIVLHEDSFDPATVQQTFTIAVPGSSEVYLIPRLLALIQREAPGVRLTLRALDYADVLDELDADRLDIGIGLMTEGQMHHKIRQLYSFGYLCLFNPELLGVSAPLSLENYLRFPHIMTSLTGADRGVVDDALAAIGKHRRIAATTPRFTTVAFHVKAAPVITTMVDELAVGFAEQLGLATSPVPVAIDRYTISMLWHSSYDQDPAHRWLRDALVRVGREAEKDHAATSL